MRRLLLSMQSLPSILRSGLLWLVCRRHTLIGTVNVTLSGNSSFFWLDVTDVGFWFCKDTSLDLTLSVLFCETLGMCSALAALFFCLIFLRFSCYPAKKAGVNWLELKINEESPRSSSSLSFALLISTAITPDAIHSENATAARYSDYGALLSLERSVL